MWNEQKHRFPRPCLCLAISIGELGVASVNYSAMIFIGPLIKAELERQERSISWFARKIGCDRSTVYRIFQRASIDTQLLTTISDVLNHDFFADLSHGVSHNATEQSQ